MAGRGFGPHARVRICFKGLSMGDHHAPDIAQKAQEGVFEGGGMPAPLGDAALPRAPGGPTSRG